MKKMKVIGLAVAIGIGSSQIAQAGIPVTVVADPQAMTAHLAELAEMLNQIAELQRQFEQMEKEYASMTGSRGLANLIDSLYDTDVISGVDVGQVLEDHGLKSSTTYGMASDVGDLYDTANENAATYSGVAGRSLIQAQDRFTELSGLVAKVNDSDDPKEIMDLQARIGAESALLQNEVAKLQILDQHAQANRALHDQRVKQMAVESSGSLRTVSW